MFFLIAIPLAMLPSLIWLLYYLRKDVHPEPNHLIMRVFVWGMVVTIIAAFIIFFFASLESDFAKRGFFIKDYLPYALTIPIVIIFINAFWEEVLKYLVVRFSILKNPEFDEPVDAMEYMIIVALAFAAVENILISANHSDLKSLSILLFVRFLGATLIHVLSSATLGFFLAKAIFWKKNRRRFPLKVGFVLLGTIIATGLHGIFNFLIIESSNLKRGGILYVVAGFLIILSFIVTREFRRLNYQSSKK
jgi:RsiW-degrading membrane proteinase PrsW (M82 family)